MKKILVPVLALLLLLSGCAEPAENTQKKSVLATTAPVAELTAALLEGTEVNVEQLITEPVSCLHDYTLSVDQMKRVEKSSFVIISGLGLEDFMTDALSRAAGFLNASVGIVPLTGEGEGDPHIWMDPDNMIVMTKNVSAGLCGAFPELSETIAGNEEAYCLRLAELALYGRETLKELSCRKLVTFHDGFSYFADAFDLEIAAAMEIEPGSEPSAKELEEIISLVIENGIPAVFTEVNGTTDAAELVAKEAAVKVRTLDMAMSLGESDYFDVMRKNINTVKDALG